VQSNTTILLINNSSRFIKLGTNVGFLFSLQVTIKIHRRISVTELNPVTKKNGGNIGLTLVGFSKFIMILIVELKRPQFKFMF